MLPETTLGLLIFVSVLIPGFVWLHRTERRALRPQRSATLEIAEITIVGCGITFISTLATIMIGQVFAPPFLKVTEWLSVTNSGYYLIQKFWNTITSIIFILLLSIIVAFFVPKIIYRKRPANINPGNTVWYDVLGQERGDRQAKLGITLTNGIFIEGLLFSYPTDKNDDQIALSQPIYCVIDGQEDLLPLDNVIIPKEQIMNIGVIFTHPSLTEPTSAQVFHSKANVAK